MAATSLSINPSLSPTFVHRPPHLLLQIPSPRTFKSRKSVVLGAGKMSISDQELREEEGEEGPPSENIQGLVELLSLLSLLLLHMSLDIKIGSRILLSISVKWEMSFPCPWYQKVPLSLALSPRIISAVARFKPDIIHASSPGIMVFGALIIAKLLSVPLSCPIIHMYQCKFGSSYIPRYTFSWLVKPMWLVIKFLHRAADLTLVPSVAIARDLLAARVTAANKIRLWNKGVDSDSFHPRYRSHEMRLRLSNGELEKPLIIHVGRLGVEKSLDFLKRIMDKLPEARIAFIGDGPYREELEKMFEGMPVVFTGMLGGEELSQAYASGDVFVMPSESETLGLVVLEAMSSGIPVVGARAGGIPDIIPTDQEGKIGYLYTPGDLEDCMSKLEPLLLNRELRETMGKAARQEMEKYDWRAATRKIRNEQYSAAIWFWRKKRAQLLRPIQWATKRIFPSPAINYR
ncbi:Sulfoquinovosyl transferase [Arachis hypogaea]|nr:Sulfoquinovosyl transferase [Arachis hypogaea]